jgi:hypothetical protein
VSGAAAMARRRTMAEPLDGRARRARSRAVTAFLTASPAASSVGRRRPAPGLGRPGAEASVALDERIDETDHLVDYLAEMKSRSRVLARPRLIMVAICSASVSSTGYPNIVMS